MLEHIENLCRSYQKKHNSVVVKISKYEDLAERGKLPNRRTLNSLYQRKDLYGRFISDLTSIIYSSGACL